MFQKADARSTQFIPLFFEKVKWIDGCLSEVLKSNRAIEVISSLVSEEVISIYFVFKGFQKQIYGREEVT